MCTTISGYPVLRPACGLAAAVGRTTAPKFQNICTIPEPACQQPAQRVAPPHRCTAAPVHPRTTDNDPSRQIRIHPYRLSLINTPSARLTYPLPMRHLPSRCASCGLKPLQLAEAASRCATRGPKCHETTCAFQVGAPLLDQSLARQQAPRIMGLR